MSPSGTASAMCCAQVQLVTGSWIMKWVLIHGAPNLQGRAPAQPGRCRRFHTRCGSAHHTNLLAALERLEGSGGGGMLHDAAFMHTSMCSARCVGRHPSLGLCSCASQHSCQRGDPGVPRSATRLLSCAPPHGVNDPACACCAAQVRSASAAATLQRLEEGGDLDASAWDDIDTQARSMATGACCYLGSQGLLGLCEWCTW